MCAAERGDVLRTLVVASRDAFRAMKCALGSVWLRSVQVLLQGVAQGVSAQLSLPWLPCFWQRCGGEGLWLEAGGWEGRAWGSAVSTDPAETPALPQRAWAGQGRTCPVRAAQPPWSVHSECPSHSSSPSRVHLPHLSSSLACP